jgi:catechol 2,3-dioxygenase-like lactoylglutathione lyase family enzyme
VTKAALVPELYVSDLVASLAFYAGVLGFEVEYERPEEAFAALRLGAAQLMLEQAPGLRQATPEEFSKGQWRTADLRPPFGRGVNLQIEVEDIDVVADRLRAAGHPLLLDPHERVYRAGDGEVRVRRLLVADPDGYLLRPSQRL